MRSFAEYFASFALRNSNSYEPSLTVGLLRRICPELASRLKNTKAASGLTQEAAIMSSPILISKNSEPKSKGHF